MDIDLRTVIVDKFAIDWSKLKRKYPQQFEFIVAATTDLAYRQRRTEVRNQVEVKNDVYNLAIITDEQFRVWSQFFSYKDWYRTFKFDQPEMEEEYWGDDDDNQWPELDEPATAADWRAEDCEEFARDEMRASSRRHVLRLYLSESAEKRRLNEIARASGYYPLDETGKVYVNDWGTTYEARDLIQERRDTRHIEKLNRESKERLYHSVMPARQAINDQLDITSARSSSGKIGLSRQVKKLLAQIDRVKANLWYFKHHTERTLRHLTRLQRQLARVEEQLLEVKHNRGSRDFTKNMLRLIDSYEDIADDYLLGSDPDEDDYMYGDFPDIDPLFDTEEEDRRHAYYDSVDYFCPECFPADRAM